MTVPAIRGGLPPLLRFLLAGACVVVILAGIKAVAPILSTFLIAGLLAQALSPIMRWLMRHGVARGLAIAITLLLVLVGGALVIALVAVSITELSHRIPTYGQNLGALRDQALGFLDRMGTDTTGLTSLEAFNPSALLGHAAAIAAIVLADLGHSFFVLLITALLLIELAILFRQLEHADHSQRTLLVRFGEMSEDLQKYLGITALMALIGSAMYTILLLSSGTPFVATWVVLYFLLGFIPVIGGVIAVTPAVLVTLLEHGMQRAVILLVVFAVLNFILGDILKPRLMQKGFEISIVAVFFSLVFWHWLLGPIGMVLAVPLTITLRKLLQEFGEDVRKAMVE